MKSSIFLRAFEVEDYLLINKWRNDINIQMSTCGTFRYVSSEMEKEWVKSKIMNNKTEVYLAICMNDDSRKMIGYVSINNINYLNRTAHGGGIVIGDKEFRDGEIRYRVGLLIREYVFDWLNMNRFTGACLAHHKESEYMMLATGYICEGVERQAVYKNGKYYDKKVFSILREDYYSLLQDGYYTFPAYVKRIRDLMKK